MKTKGAPPNTSYFSIISVCFNAPTEDVETSFQSLHRQNFKDYEHIVIDGGSHPETLNKLKEYEESYSTFISEPDNGIYDAMNKGLNYVNGKVVYFLNIGDTFTERDTLSKIHARLADTSHSGGVYCNVNLSEGIDTKYARRLTPSWICANGISHQAIFAKVQVFEKLGGFDSSLRIVADNDWLIRAINANFAFGYCPEVLTAVLPGGVSSATQKVTEEKEILKERYLTRFQRATFPLYYVGSKVLGRIRQRKFHLPPNDAMSN
jgi:glycosyltransferase involved in cell wall biosynthesis